MERLQPDLSRVGLLERVREESGLTPSQLHIWLGQALHPTSPLYNMAFAYVLSGRIDPGRFRAAWRAVVSSSDALRTSIEQRGNRSIRVVRRADDEEMTVLDFGHLPDPGTAFRTWAAERCTCFLPLEGRLVDSVLVRLGDRQWGWYLNQHHLVTDAWATVLLFQHVAGVYASSADSGVHILALDSYYETARALESFPDAETRADAGRHWQRRHNGDRAFPLYGRPARVTSTASERHPLVLSDVQSERLRRLAAQPGFLALTPEISIFVVFATALCAWLHRVTGRLDVGFDAPAHNRPTRSAKRCLGLFIEMFPFAVELEESDTFRAVGHKCLAEAQDFLRHALPGASVPSGSSTSNVVLNFFSAGHGDFAGIPVESEWMHSGASDNVHALRFQIHDYDRTGRYTLHFDFNEETLPPALRARAVDHFERLVFAMLDDPDRTIGSVDLMSHAERETLLVEFNETPPHPFPSATVVGRFDEQAARTPDRVAVRQGARQMTFAELHRQVRAAACSLDRIGVKPGNSVAVFAHRSIETVIGLLAVLQVGAHYVPLDVKYPARRTSDILADSCPACVLIGRDVPRDRLPADANVHRIADLLGDPRQQRASSGPQLQDLAYVIYTSGSTGRPKGVPVEHRGLADYLEWAERTYVRGEALSYPLFTSLAFDLTVTSLFLPLLTGGMLVIYREPDDLPDSALADVIRDNAVDFIKLTPSHLSLVTRMDLSGSRIRRIVVGGEDFKTHLAAAAAAQIPAAEIYNEYGPTEAVVGCMVHRYDTAVDTGTSVPIGRPADHVQLYVLTRDLALVPEGVPGELFISRHGLAGGYHSRSDLTAQAFIPHPFRKGDRLYRTGDLVRFVRPGCLEYLGRLDRQLKVAGLRVEPGEIETALRTHEAIQQCIVVGHRVGGGATTTASPPLRCQRCGLASNHPAATFDDEGLCSICRSFDAVRDYAQAYFRTMADLRSIFDKAKKSRGAYDAMVLLSGGKDSTYALCRVVDMGVKVYAFSFDNGYISDRAKENIRRVVAALGVDHEFASTPAMPAIFRDSLTRFSNVCNGCFKAIYTLGINRAYALGIPVVVTGLTRGQLFETRLTPDLFENGRRSPEEVDAAVLEARKTYHRLDDQVARSLDAKIFRDDRVFEEVQVVDFYRYCDADLTEILSYLDRKAPWIRPSDTGRSTNCLINDVGIYIHQKERGFHNYGLPSSWDVRMGHKTRTQAVEELQDRLDMPRVRRILAEIGYDENRLVGTRDGIRLDAYYVSSRDVSDSELRSHVSRVLPPQLVPRSFTPLQALPLTNHGKIDEAALHSASRSVALSSGRNDTAPEGPVEERIAAIWCDVLGVDHVGRHASLFELGGTSLGAMDIVLRVCEAFDIDLPLRTVFKHATVEQLAKQVEALIVAEVAEMSEEIAERLAGGSSEDR